MKTPWLASVRASAPGSIGNFGPGLDVLGCAVAGARDRVTAEWNDAPGVTLADAGHAELPSSPARHTSAIAAAEVLRRALDAGLSPPRAGIALRVSKELPLSGGQGGSAASAVAGAFAANALLGGPLGSDELIAACLAAEAKVAGRHADNIAPSLLGGIVLVRSLDPIDAVRVPVPAGLHLVLAHPAQRLSTAAARRALPVAVPLATVVHQLAQVAAVVAACHAGDLHLLGRAMTDAIAEPARTSLLPGFADARRAALDAGALGAGISGAGPTAFALAPDRATAERVGAAMQRAYAAYGLECDVRATTVDEQGARLDDSP